MKPDPQAFQESAARALQRVAADRPTLLPSCQQPGVAGSAPARRFTQVAEGLQSAGAGATIQS
ncbi:MAG: hypothetical protein AAF552_17270, partial [Pseudomonadota bacterium]